jgi:hypothetical protein
MSERHNFSKDVTTKGGKFVRGEIVGKLSLNNEGYVYEVKADPKSVKKLRQGGHVLTAPAKVVGVRKVTKKEVLARGWKVTEKS